MSQSPAQPLGESFNGYVCFYKGKQVEVRAATTFKAQQTAVAYFQKGQRAKVKSWEVTPVLAEKSGEQVVHAPLF